jgi:ribulose-phosphate 3-epimerase
MVAHPEQWISDFANAGADMYTFHLEATRTSYFFLNVENPTSIIEKVKKTGMKVGIAIKPQTPVEQVFPYCGCIDMVLVMTVGKPLSD